LRLGVDNGLRQSCALRQAHPTADLCFSVNVSALRLAQPVFCAGLAEMVAAEGLPAAALCLEVSESMNIGIK
jgi:EAL domain-containing protein (putative c-di-GMP-specific phosphodiesterase class I)